MSRKKKTGSYTVHFSMDTWEGDHTVDVPAEDVEGMSEEEMRSYFQQCVDDEVNRNGPNGFVDSVDEPE